MRRRTNGPAVEDSDIAETPTTEDTALTPECTSSDARSATDKAAHTHEHLDLTDLTPQQRWTLALTAAPWLNATSLADQIRDGRADRLPLDEIDRPGYDATTELAEALGEIQEDSWFRAAGRHLERVAMRAAYAGDHTDWHEAPFWCICDTDTTTSCCMPG